jgi:menaquinone-dependent protoporphyrinogen oxidase
MERTVLVTYATRYGSTAEVARAVAQEINAYGIEVICRPMQTFQDLEPYCAVVLGAALYMGRLHKDARRFLTEHRSDLSRLPVALFVSGPVHAAEKDWVGAREQMDKELTKFPWFSPVSRKLVGGRFDPALLKFPMRLIPSFRKMPVSDVRDWTDIRAWARHLRPTLEPMLH